MKYWLSSDYEEQRGAPLDKDNQWNGKMLRKGPHGGKSVLNTMSESNVDNQKEKENIKRAPRWSANIKRMA